MDAPDFLIDAILAAPEDDTPRLACADWFDEHGDPRRAELIRVQCRRARWDRLSQAAAERISSPPAGFSDPPYLWSRGFRSSLESHGQGRRRLRASCGCWRQ